MSSGITVIVKLKPYLKEWVLKRYGPEPVRASSSNKIFPMLAGYLSSVPADYKPIHPDSKHIAFELPYNKILDIRNKSYISPKYYGQIQSFFYGQFYFDFVLWMNKCVIDQRFSFKWSIVQYCVENDISFDHANYDSLKRLYLRYRKREDLTIENTHKKSPTIEKHLQSR